MTTPSPLPFSSRVWTTRDVAAYLGTTPDYFRKAWPRLVKAGFPRPLAWPQRPRRWVPEMIRAWASHAPAPGAADAAAIDPAMFAARLANLKQRRAKTRADKE